MTNLYPFSDKDPGGLLLLPEKNDLAKMNISEVLAVMDTLVSVAAREVSSGCLPVFFVSCLWGHVMWQSLVPPFASLQYECTLLWFFLLLLLLLLF